MGTMQDAASRPGRLPQARRDRLDCERILASVGEVANELDIESDVLAWGSNVRDALPFRGRGADRPRARVCPIRRSEERNDAVRRGDARGLSLLR